MSDLNLILTSYFILFIFIILIYKLSYNKSFMIPDEFRVGLTGSAIFMHISWLIIFIANINPFIEPEFKNKKNE